MTNDQSLRRVDYLSRMFYFVICVPPLWRGTARSNFMPGIGVITNPKAKRNLKRPWIREALQRIVGDAGRVYETRSIAELPRVAEEFIERDLDILVVNGGDGTTHIALTHFVPAYGDRPLPKLLSLRGGTMNTISKSIKHKGKGENILASVVRKVRNNEPLDIVRQPSIHVNDRYGFMYGLGVAGNFLEAYYKGTTLGPLHAANVVARIIVSAIFQTQFAKNLFAPCPSKFIIDGRTVDMPECKVALAASIMELGLGARLTYRAYEKPGYVHLRALSISPFHVVPRLLHLFRGWRVSGVMDELAREIIIETGGNHPYTIDGELYKDTNIFRISQGPIINIIREGVKKPPKGIGLPQEYVPRVLPESTSSEKDDGGSRRTRIEISPYLNPLGPA